MKRLSIAFIAVAALLLVSCKSEQKKQAEVNPNLIQPEMHLSKQDTTEVRTLTMQFFDRLKQKDLNGAITMLNYYENGSIVPLPPELEAKERMALGMFLGMKYDIDHIIFLKDDDSEVKYTVTMFEKDKDDPRPNKTSFLIRPVRHLGKWYLTLADKQTDKVKSEIKH